MPDLNRRGFLGATAAAAATAAFTDLAHAKAESVGPEKVRIAVMGLNGRGRGLISAFARFSNVEITYVCDPDTSQFPGAVKRVTDTGRNEPEAVKDFRTVLDRRDVDVLVCAAPDHWHALATVLACQAGKDVYVEKPVSHNIVRGTQDGAGGPQAQPRRASRHAAAQRVRVSGSRAAGSKRPAGQRPFHPRVD